MSTDPHFLYEAANHARHPSGAIGATLARPIAATARHGEASPLRGKHEAMLASSKDAPWQRVLADAQRAADLIADADALIIAGGAGMSADSGLPIFQGNGGFWRGNPALAAAGITFIDIASPQAFRRDTRHAWGFYGQGLQQARHAVPHVGYQILRRWARATPRGAFVFTSNVDGHFERAGFDSRQIEECHGTLHRLQCLDRCTGRTWPASSLLPAVEIAQGLWRGALPACPHCGGLARPNVRLFDDRDWLGARHLHQARRRRCWLGAVRRPVVIEVGAGRHFPTVRRFAQRIADQHAGALIRINPDLPRTGEPGIGIAAGAVDALRVIDSALRRRHHREI